SLFWSLISGDWSLISKASISEPGEDSPEEHSFVIRRPSGVGNEPSFRPEIIDQPAPEAHRPAFVAETGEEQAHHRQSDFVLPLEARAQPALPLDRRRRFLRNRRTC